MANAPTNDHAALHPIGGCQCNSHTHSSKRVLIVTLASGHSHIGTCVWLEKPNQVKDFGGSVTAFASHKVLRAVVRLSGAFITMLSCCDECAHNVCAVWAVERAGWSVGRTKESKASLVWIALIGSVGSSIIIEVVAGNVLFDCSGSLNSKYSLVFAPGNRFSFEPINKSIDWAVFN